MGWWSRVKKKVRRTYDKVDRSVGGHLPGGQSPSQVKAEKTKSSSRTSSSSGSSSSTSNSSNSTSSSYRRSSGGSSSRRSSSSSTNKNLMSTAQGIKPESEVYSKSNNLKTSNFLNSYGLERSNKNKLGSSSFSLDNRRVYSNRLGGLDSVNSEKLGATNFNNSISSNHNLNNTKNNKNFFSQITSLPKNTWNWAGSHTPEFSIPIFVGAGGKIKMSKITEAGKEWAESTPQGQQKELNKQVEGFNKKWDNSSYIKNNTFIGTDEQYNTYTSEYQNITSTQKIISSKKSWGKGAEYLISSGISKLPTTYGQLGLITAGAYTGGLALKTISTGYSMLPAGVQTAGSIIGTTAEVGVTGYNLKQSTNKDLEYSQRITSGMFTGLGVTSLGIKTTNTAIDIYRTTGRTQLQSSQVIPKDVYSGKTNFPLAGSSSMSNIQRAKIHKKLFETSEYNLPGETTAGGYHTYPKPWKNLETQKGTSELQGTYMSYGVSPHFAKVSGAGETMKINLLPKIQRPGTMYIKPIGFKTGKFAEQGYAFVPGIKTEVEAIIPPGTQLIKTTGDYYYKFRGRKIPIDRFETTGGLGFSSKNVKSLNEFSSMYSTPSSSFSVGGSVGALGFSKAKTNPSNFEISKKVSSSIPSSSNPLVLPTFPSKSYNPRSRRKSSGQSYNPHLPIPFLPISLISKSPTSSSPISKVSKLLYDPSPHNYKRSIFLPKLSFRLKEKIPKRRVKIKKVIRYTPSYSALIFNIKGKAPKGIETGLRVRPITRGTDNLLNIFSGKTPKIYNPFQIPRIKRKRIIKKRKVKRR